MHSAEANEGNSTELSSSDEKGLGCAYAAGIGAVTTLNASSELLALAGQEQPLAANNEAIIKAANETVANYFFTQAPGAGSLGREDFRQL